MLDFAAFTEVTGPKAGKICSNDLPLAGGGYFGSETTFQLTGRAHAAEATVFTVSIGGWVNFYMCTVGELTITPSVSSITYTRWEGRRAIMHVVYSAGIFATSSNTGAISVASGVTYRIVMQVLRNDLGDAGEDVSGVTFNGQSIGACNPDGGDYDCTFYNCNSELTMSTYTATSDTINVDLTYTGHSYDCDCDVNDWSCSMEGTVAGRTKVTAVARFTLIPCAL